jgi:hypothetical protein
MCIQVYVCDTYVFDISMICDWCVLGLWLFDDVVMRLICFWKDCGFRVA